MSAGVQVWRWGEDPAPLAALVAAGGVLAIPTESSYGLAVDPRSAAGVERIFEIKGRPSSKALPVVAADAAQVTALGASLEHPDMARLAELWPAPLSLVLPLARSLPAAAEDSTLAVRVPDHAPLRELLAQLGTALTATSANRSGDPPVLDPAVLPELLAGHPAAIVDGGVLAGGAPSTLVAVTAQGVQVLRPGRYPLDRLRQAVPELVVPNGFSAATVENRCG